MKRNYLAEVQKRVLILFPPIKDFLISFKDGVRFCLPDNGEIIEDQSLKAIPNNTHIRLPFEKICLEFDLTQRAMPGVRLPTVVLLRDEGNEILGTAAVSHAHKWMAGVMFKINSAAGLERVDGKPNLIYSTGYDLANTTEAQAAALTKTTIRAMCDLLNALACTNVEMTERRPSRTAIAMGRANPRDTYYELTVDVNSKVYDSKSQGGSHASPREHLRRGHIRHLSNGKCIWINALVVNPGVGGRIDKDYKIKVH